ncbi:oxygen-dependent choline dehydrogenase [Tanacetum coccineum]
MLEPQTGDRLVNQALYFSNFLRLAFIDSFLLFSNITLYTLLLRQNLRGESGGRGRRSSKKSGKGKRPGKDGNNICDAERAAYEHLKSICKPKTKVQIYIDQGIGPWEGSVGTQKGCMESGRSGPLAYGVAFEDSLLNTHIACLKDEQKDEIILSVGALGSPQLLVLSGIGPRKQLDALKIKVVLRDMKRVWLKKKKHTIANLKKGQGINEYVWKDVTMLNATLLETRAKLLLTSGYFDYGEEVMHFASSGDGSSTSSPLSSQHPD